MVLVAGLGGVVLGAGICIALIVLLADLTNFSDYGDMTGFEDEMGMGMGLAEQYETDSAAVGVNPMDCLDGTEPADADVATVPCEDAHELEVFVRRPIFEEEDATYSSDDLEILGDAMCVAGFESYVDKPYFDSDLEYRTFVPSEEAWDEGQRDVVCVLFDLDGTTLEGTSKDSGR